jgi:uncharacterized protein YigA (DUF484 family)
MDGLVTTDLRSASRCHTQGEDAAGNGREHELPTIAFPIDNSINGNSADTVHLFGQSSFDLEADDISRLLRSFDMVFQLHQRSEEIRTHLERIDGILLKSRTVDGLIERVTGVLEKDLDLAVARILIRADHPVASLFRRVSPSGGGVIPSHFLANESVTTDPFVLDDPAGDLSYTLFGESDAVIGSAAVASLCPGNEDLGLLCLGSSDPHRYCGGMNTDLIASLAEKIALGIKNAWDHENAVKGMLRKHSQGVFTETFFLEYLDKEFHRAWRTRRPFSLAAMSWSSPESGCSPSPAEVTDLVLKNIRSGDVAAHGDTVSFWFLLPDTDANAAKNIAQRLLDAADERFDGELVLHVGMTEFSKDSTVLSMLIDRAKSALHKAEENSNRIVVELC